MDASVVPIMVLVCLCTQLHQDARFCTLFGSLRLCNTEALFSTVQRLGQGPAAWPYITGSYICMVYKRSSSVEMDAEQCNYHGSPPASHTGQSLYL